MFNFFYFHTVFKKNGQIIAFPHLELVFSTPGNPGPPQKSANRTRKIKETIQREIHYLLGLLPFMLMRSLGY